MKLFGEKSSSDNSRKVILGCCKGELCALEETGDDIMSSGILGEGFAVYPDYETDDEDKSFAEAASPVSGRVIDVTAKPNAAVLKTDDGLKVLMSFSDFSSDEVRFLIKAGDTVEAGKPAVRLTPLNNEKRGIYIVVENSDILVQYKLKKGQTAADKTAMEYSL